MRLMKLRPDLWDRLSYLTRPLKDDLDVDLLTTLHQFGLLKPKRRVAFVKQVRAAAIEEADDSFLENDAIASVLTEKERNLILADVATEVLDRVGNHVDRLRRSWESDYDPNDYFDSFRTSIRRFADAMHDRVDFELLRRSTESHIRSAVEKMEDDYNR